MITKTVNGEILKNIYKKRPSDSRKYDFGMLLVIGGSEFYSGSPAFSAMAAFRSGVDMVKIIAPKRAADIIASFSPNLVAYPLEGNLLEEKHLPDLIAMTESAKAVSRGKTAVVIGGGAGRSEQTKKVISKYLSQIDVPVVIDADAIHAIAENPEIISGKPFLITPHTYEFFILTGQEIRELPEEEKIKLVREQADKLKTTILLKGPMDIISDSKESAVSKTGISLMAKGGTGDTLAGIAGALMARGVAPFEAGQAAAYINGMAGQLAARKFGESMTAVDLVDFIYEFLPRA